MKLAPHEVKIVSLLALGHKDREIATQLHLTEGTVKVYVAHLYRKLGFVKTWGNHRIRLVLWWLENERAKSSSASPAA